MTECYTIASGFIRYWETISCPICGITQKADVVLHNRWRIDLIEGTSYSLRVDGVDVVKAYTSPSIVVTCRRCGHENRFNRDLANRWAGWESIM